MKDIIIYVSKHHQNTKKVVDFLTEKFHIEAVNAENFSKDISQYDNIIFMTGIYAFQLDESISKLIENLPLENKRCFLIYTSAMDVDSFGKAFIKQIQKKNVSKCAFTHIPGFCTFGPFKLFKGVRKNHPDANDLEKVADFYQEEIADEKSKDNRG